MLKLRHTLITVERTCEGSKDAFQNAHLGTVALDEGSDDRTSISFRAHHFLKVGTAFDDLVRGARQSDLPHGGKSFTFEPVLDSGGHLAVCMYDCRKRVLRVVGHGEKTTVP